MKRSEERKSGGDGASAQRAQWICRPANTGLELVALATDEAFPGFQGSARLHGAVARCAGGDSLASRGLTWDCGAAAGTDRDQFTSPTRARAWRATFTRATDLENVFLVAGSVAERKCATLCNAVHLCALLQSKVQGGGT